MGQPNNTFWTPDRVAKLRALWPRPMLMKDIGAELGCSMNAIASKARILNLPARRVSKYKPPVSKSVIGRSRPESKTRTCLKCRTQFESFGNYVCAPCSDVNRTIAPIAEGFGL